MIQPTITHPESLLRKAWTLFRSIRPQGWDVELFWEQEQEWEQSWAEGKRKNLSFGFGSGLAVRAIKNGRWGFASGTDTSSAGLRCLFERACTGAQSLPFDEARVLPRPRRSLKSIASGIPHPDSPIKTTVEKWHRLRNLEQMALRGDSRKKKVINLSFHEGRGVRALVSSTGIKMAEPWTAVSFSGELLGSAGTETETAWGAAESTHWSGLDPESVVNDMGARLLMSFGGRPLRSGKWTVLVHPRVGADLMELISLALLGDAAQKGRSFLARQLGKKVASPLVSVVDDGLMPNGVGTRLWDDEGVPQRRTVVITDGKLQSFLHDTASARRAGTTSTGNGSRDGRESPPSPGPTNFSLQPGKGSETDLYQTTEKAFEVRDVIGLHTADPVSGDFSVGASGLLWEKGKVRHAVRGVTLSGNLLDLLAGVDAISNRVVWQGAMGSPLFRVKELSVGGD